MKVRVDCSQVVPEEFGLQHRKEPPPNAPLSSEAIPTFLTDQA